METTIQISKELLSKLKHMKISSKESYETLIWNLVEDRLALSEETKATLAKSEKDIREGSIISLESMKRKRGI